MSPSLMYAAAKRQLSPLIFPLYNLHVVPKCLTLSAKCCKICFFDFTDGKDLLAHEAHLLRRKATHQIPFTPPFEFEVYQFPGQNC